MKKFLLLFICAGLSVSAWAYRSQMNHVEQKIKTLTLLEEKAFDWEDEYYGPEYEKVVQLAKQVYEQNPGSFNAAYNYGLLRYAVSENEIGPCASDEQLKTAFDAFEHARSLAPNKIILFEREYDVLKRLLIGADVPTRLLIHEEIFDIYVENPKYSQKFVEVITRTFPLNGLASDQKAPEATGLQDWQDRALQAFLIRLSQKEYDKAVVWLKRLGGPSVLKKAWFLDHEDAYIMSKKNEYPQEWKAQQARYNEALSHVGIDVSKWQKELDVRREVPAKNAIRTLKQAFQNKKK